MFRLAQRNGIALTYASVEELTAAYDFPDLQGFLDIYYAGMGVLQEVEDFYDLTIAYLKRARTENVRHAEIFFDPQGHTRRGVPLGLVIEGITSALSEGVQTLGITSRRIMCFLRDLSAGEAMATLEASLPYRDHIVAVGLDSAEIGHPPSKFRDVFARARSEGFLTVAHAGEEGPASYIREALDELRVKRIDHGVRAMEDSDLIARFRCERIPLTVCPLSNDRLKIYGDIAAHPIKAMWEAGLFVTVNSDDPAYFGGYVNRNYCLVKNAFAFPERDLAEMARNSFEASFLEKSMKQAHLKELDAHLAQYHL